LTYLHKALVFKKDDFGLPHEFIFNIYKLNVLKTNLKIEIKRFQKLTNEKAKFLLKLPKRTVRYLLK